MGTGVRRCAASWLVVAATLVTTVSTPAITPIWGTSPAATQSAIANRTGSQTDPHVSGDIAAFTADAAGGMTQIPSYDFQLGVLTSIANRGSFDLLSNSDGKRSGDLATACSLLDAFKNEVVAQSGKALTPDQAFELLLAADAVKGALGCL